MTTHASILAWKIPWTEEPGGLRSMGHKQSDMNVGLRTHSCIPISGVRLNGLFILCLSEFESVSGK